MQGYKEPQSAITMRERKIVLFLDIILSPIKYCSEREVGVICQLVIDLRSILRLYYSGNNGLYCDPTSFQQIQNGSTVILMGPVMRVGLLQRPDRVVRTYKCDTGSVYLAVVVYRTIGNTGAAQKGNTPHAGSTFQCLLHGG